MRVLFSRSVSKATPQGCNSERHPLQKQNTHSVSCKNQNCSQRCPLTTDTRFWLRTMNAQNMFFLPARFWELGCFCRQSLGNKKEQLCCVDRPSLFPLLGARPAMWLCRLGGKCVAEKGRRFRVNVQPNNKKRRRHSARTATARCTVSCVFLFRTSPQTGFTSKQGSIKPQNF